MPWLPFLPNAADAKERIRARPREINDLHAPNKNELVRAGAVAKTARFPPDHILEEKNVDRRPCLPVNARPRERVRHELCEDLLLDNQREGGWACCHGCAGTGGYLCKKQKLMLEPKS